MSKIKILIVCILWFTVGYWSCQLDFPFKKEYAGGVLFGDNWLTLKVKLPEFVPFVVYTTSRINDYYILDYRR